MTGSFCRICKQTKPRSEFYGDKRRSSAVSYACKKCHCAIAKKWRDENKEKVKETQQRWEADNVAQRRDSYYRRIYGITLDQYNEILEFQDGRCYICQRLPKKKNLAVDHNHQTKEVRGLLCDWCNQRILGGSHEKVEILERAIDYLTVPPARSVLVDGE